MTDPLRFAVFWGVWLLVPVLIDGLTTLFSLVGVFWARLRKPVPPETFYFPHISVIVPVYNSADTLGDCLRSIAAQDYPLDRIEVLVINNGSTDHSFEVFTEIQQTLTLNVHWHSIYNKGKAWALNAGIHICQGEYIFNVDSDVVLSPEAFSEVVKTMDADPDLGAVTGAIMVLPPVRGASLLQRILGYCEFYEYMAAFLVGREHQTLVHNLYTLSGAFSVFRREVLLQTFLYSQETVTEDTDLTFELYARFKDKRIGAVSRAIAYVHPIESVGALYAQRVRWQRGQLEVSARYPALMNRPMWQVSGFNPGRVLAIDHTLAFPRLVWTFLIPVLAIFGYSLSLIFMSTVLTYIFYMLIDILWVVVALYYANQLARQRLAYTWWVIPLLPLYRIIVFWFRFSGFLHAIAETGTWRVSDPWVQVKAGGQDVWQRLAQAWRRFRQRG
ncbi:MAG: putative glycosyltransferase, exosortase G system-associated [Anaerolineales bacterium]|nr:putative glycosyltransferase, exosortase G system-associated [Anaerolineales bacterium]